MQGFPIPLSGIKRFGRIIVKYYSLGLPHQLNCPECEYVADTHQAAQSGPNEPIEFTCPYCRIPIGIASSPLADIPLTL